MKEKPKTILCEVDLELRRIAAEQVGFKIINPNQIASLGLDHLELDRRLFPSSDDFNLDFINRRVAPSDKETRAKQAELEKYTRLHVVITANG